MAYSIGVLNNIRANASDEYQNRIPEATQNNIASIGNALATYTLLYNEFCSALVNKIGKTIIEQKLFKNKLARFKSGAVNTQQDVEEIFIEMAKAEGSYDKTGSNPLGRRELPDVKAIYHRQNRQDYYAISIGDIDFVRVFKSPTTLDAFISGLINSVYSADAYDEWVAMKQLLGSYEGYATATLSAAPTTTDGCKAFVKTVRKVANDLTFASANYNGAGVTTWTDPSKLVLFVNKDVITEIDVELLAQSFNMGKTDLNVEVVTMDDFGGLANTYAILADADFFRVFDTLSRMETQRNAQGLFTNYFYHHHQILSLSTFKNAVAFQYTE